MLFLRLLDLRVRRSCHVHHYFHFLGGFLLILFRSCCLQIYRVWFTLRLGILLSLLIFSFFRMIGPPCRGIIGLVRSGLKSLTFILGLLCYSSSTLWTHSSRPHTLICSFICWHRSVLRPCLGRTLRVFPWGFDGFDDPSASLSSLKDSPCSKWSVTISLPLL